VSPAEIQADDVSVTLRVRVTDKGGGIGNIIWKVNGQRVGSAYGATALNANGEVTLRNQSGGSDLLHVELAATDNTIEVVAENKSGLVASKPVGVKVKVDPRALRGDPDLYILAAGVDTYEDAKHKLSFAVSDATDLSEALADAGSTFYRHKPQIVLLRNGEVTAERLAAAFKELGAKVKARDVFLFFIAGHGKNIGGDYYFVPRGIAAFTDDAIRRQGFGPQQWLAWSESIKAQKSIFIFDTCDSGAVAKVWTRGLAEDDAAYQRMKDATGRVIFMASSDQQTANEGFREHGLLTYTLLEGLAKAGSGDKIDLTDLKKYVELKVPDYAKEMKNGCVNDRGQLYCQRPLVDIFSRDYPLVPRYPQILAKLDAGGPLISTKPTHVVMAATDLLEQAARGSPVTRQLEAGTLVTVFEPIKDGWAHVAQEGTPIGYIPEERLLKMKQ
jgi:hypothetical protein